MTTAFHPFPDNVAERFSHALNSHPMWGSLLSIRNGIIAAAYVGNITLLYWLTANHGPLPSPQLTMPQSAWAAWSVGNMSFWVGTGIGIVGGLWALGRTYDDWRRLRLAKFAVRSGGHLFAEILGRATFRQWLIKQYQADGQPLRPAKLTDDELLLITALLSQYRHGNAPGWLRQQIGLVLPRLESVAAAIDRPPI